MSDAQALLARYLRQRRELGESEVVLSREGMEAVRSLGDRPSTMGKSTASGGSPVARAATPTPTQPPASAMAEVMAPPPVATRSPGDTSAIAGATSLDGLCGIAGGCVACALATTRTTVVFGEGNPEADLVVVGEAPGADEDRTGRPFVGRAGRLLDSLLLSIGFPRPSVYICNVLKCRPPGNRNPRPEEVEQCSPFLRRQLEILAPRAILAVGTFPAQTLLATTESIGRLRGRVHEYQGIPLVPTYHPAALLRNPAWIRPVWEDLQRLRAAFDR